MGRSSGPRPKLRIERFSHSYVARRECRVKALDAHEVLLVFGINSNLLQRFRALRLPAMEPASGLHVRWHGEPSTVADRSGQGDLEAGCLPRPWRIHGELGGV